MGKDRGIISVNPCERGGRLYRGSRAEKIWTDDDEAAFYRAAPPHLHLPLLIALWTGQRQGDLLRLTWHAYDGECIRLQQSKTGARVVVPVGMPLRRALDAIQTRGERILLTSDGKPWTADGFRSSFGKARIAAGIQGVTFNDLRGTAVTRLAIAECTEAEIATITGIRYAMFAASWMRIISIVIHGSAKAQFESSKGERRFPTKLPIVPLCSK